MSTRMTPNQREVIAAVDSASGNPVYPTATNRKLDVNATASLAGSSIPISGATTAVGVAIVDGSGNQITSFGGGTQYTDGGTPPTHPVAPTLVFDNSGTWQHISASSPLPVTGGGGGTQYQELATTSPATGTLSLGRYSSSLPTLTNEQLNEPMLDSSSRLLVNGSGVTQPVSLATNTPTLQSGSTTAVTQTTAANLNATVVGTGTFAVQAAATLNAETTKVIGVTRTADGSGNLLTSTTNALDVNIKSGNPTSITANAGTNLNTSALALETGGNLASIASSNTTIATNTGASSTSANQTNGTQQTKITNGTNIADILAANTANSTGNGLLTAGTGEIVSWTTTTNIAVGATDVGNYSFVSVQCTTVGAGGTGAFQVSNDNVNWVGATLFGSTNPGTGAAASNLNAAGVFSGTIQARYFRIIFSGISSGTYAGTFYFSTVAHAPAVTAVSVGNPSSFNGLQVTSTPLTATNTGTITTSSSSVTSSNNSGIGWQSISIHGTYAGVQFGITQSDDTGTTFYNVPVFDTNASQWLPPGSTITPGTNASRTYWVPTAANSNETKVLASAYSSGTATINIRGGAAGILPFAAMSQIMDAAGNNRGANVTASNELVVSDSGLRPASTSLNTYSNHITTNTTNTPTASTAYISSIAISNEVGGTTSTITIQDKQGTPLKLVNGIATTALTTAPTIISFNTPVKMVSGIDVITAGAVAATVDVWINYYQ